VTEQLVVRVVSKDPVVVMLQMALPMLTIPFFLDKLVALTMP
jgi:hypothetical protein